MSTPAIAISNLSKAYRVWPHPSDMLKEVLTGRRRHSEFHALRDINLEVPRGGIVGIMGRNGAGKSTLLRIVAGTLDATAGSARVNGRIAAILELGTGFHQDYTGRENIKLGGMCLGLSPDEIRAREDEIIDFAELREFIDRPFRTYSSGMQARLTFAVATSIDPDILIIDEALSVGDARFQLRSFDRIRDFKRRGKSILLVSHDIHTITAICDKAVLLERGSVHTDGEPGRVGNIYHELLFGSPAEKQRPATPPVTSSKVTKQVPELGAAAPEATTQSNADLAAKSIDAGTECVKPSKFGDAPLAVPPIRASQRYGDRNVEFTEIAIVDRDGNSTLALQSLGQYRIHCCVHSKISADDIHLGILLRNAKGLEVFGWDTKSASLGALSPFEAGETRRMALAFSANLGPGTFFLTLALARANSDKEDVCFDAIEFTCDARRSIHDSSITNLECRIVVC